MRFATLDLVARTLVVVGLVYASAVALTHWAVRSRRITPFGAWPRFMRRAGDPLLVALQHPIVPAGGESPGGPPLVVGVGIARGALRGAPGARAGGVWGN